MDIEQKIQELCEECNWLESLICVSGCKMYNHLLYLQELEKQDYSRPQWESHPVADASLDNKMSCEDYDGH